MDAAFEKWLDGARVLRRRLSPDQVAVLQAAFAFLQKAGQDYASKRIVAHFLVNCQSGLKLAQVARLVGFTRPTVSRQKRLSSREVNREIQHHYAGRPYGKLLPRYAGPVAEFIIGHPDASREDILDFIERTWQVQVSSVALHNFLKKYGLDRASRGFVTASQPREDPTTDEDAFIAVLDDPLAPGLPLTTPPESHFFWDRPPTPAPSC